ncbi:MAG: hypothetical protein KDJ90_11195 [Nitratireductor sp.]|nr:hypothetical protein [Nitratireductor sp.]
MKRIVQVSVWKLATDDIHLHSKPDWQDGVAISSKPWANAPQAGSVSISFVQSEKPVCILGYKSKALTPVRMIQQAAEAPMPRWQPSTQADHQSTRSRSDPLAVRGLSGIGCPSSEFSGAPGHFPDTGSGSVFIAVQAAAICRSP